MDKIRITGLRQGTKRLQDNSYAIGFQTKYGVCWISSSLWWKFKAQNYHLWKAFIENTSIDSRNLIGRYLYVTDKEHQREHDNMIYIGPLL